MMILISKRHIRYVLNKRRQLAITFTVSDKEDDEEDEKSIGDKQTATAKEIEIENERKYEQKKNDVDHSLRKDNAYVGVQRKIMSKNDLAIKSDLLATYLANQYKKMNISNSKGIRAYFKTIWDLRSLLIPCIAHFFDTASDIALVLEWYILYKKGTYSDEGISMTSLFFCSLSVLIYYRLSSMYEVFRFSQSIKDSILQFIFDYYLIKAVYVNIYKMRSYKALSFVKIIRGLEGATESSFQSILALVFIFKFDSNNTIAIISLVTSLYSLVTRIIFQDAYKIIPTAQEAGLSFEDLFINFKFRINNNWLIFVLFRFLDVISNIICIALIWHIIGGEWLLLLGGTTIICFIIFALIAYGNLPVKWIFFALKTPLGYLPPNAFIVNKFNFRISIKLQRFPAILFFFIRFVLTATIFIKYFFIKNSTKGDSDSSMFVLLIVECVVCNFVIPLIFFVFISKLTVPRSNRTTYSGGFDIGQAIFTKDFDYITFSKLMNANVFYPHSRFIKHPCIEKIIPTIMLKNAKRSIESRGICMTEALAMQSQFSDEIYNYLKNWYDEIYFYNTGNNINININHKTKKTKIKNVKILTFEEYLVSLMDNLTAWIVARRARNIEIFNKLTEGGIDFSKYTNTNQRGWNMLQQTCLSNNSANVEVVEWFLKNQCYDINAKTFRKHTALHGLILKIQKRKKVTIQDRKVFCLLLKYGIDLFAVNDDQMSFPKLDEKKALFLCDV